MSYESKIKALENPSFDAIRSIAMDEISHLSREEKDVLWQGLKRGTALLT
jgi:hypothetical protein